MATIEIDDEVYEALRLPEGERSKAMKQELAVALYARDILSFGKARELAELSKHDFHKLLGEREIPRHYTEAELDRAVEPVDPDAPWAEPETIGGDGEPTAGDRTAGSGEGDTADGDSHGSLSDFSEPN